MSVLLKLFSFCTMVKVNRQQLIKPDRNTISIMLGALNLVCFIKSFVILELCCLEHGKVKHQRVFQLSLLDLTLLPINFIFKLDALFAI